MRRHFVRRRMFCLAFHTCLVLRRLGASLAPAQQLQPESHPLYSLGSTPRA